jgi:nucleoside-diphosphate-sugar epimerase
MKVLLVGGNSSLAHCLRPVLLEFAEVVTAGRSGCDLPLDLEGAIHIPGGFDAVVNTAAHLGGTTPAALTNAEETNVVGLLRLGQACTKAGVGHLVQVSSLFATLPHTSPFHNAYALSKRHGDEALQLQASMQDLPLTIVRPAQFLGVGEQYRRNQPFLFTLIDKAQAGQDIELWGRRDALRNFIHVQDVADIIARVVSTRTLGVFTCSHPQNLSFSQISQAAVDAFGSRSTIRFLHDKPDTVDNIFPFDDELYRALGHTLQFITIAQGMQMEAAHRRSPA